MMAKPVLVVTGTLREAGLVKGPGIMTVAGGSDAAGLVRRLREAAPHVAGVISFGMAGGLDPRLPLGGLIIGTGVTGVFPRGCDAGWAKALKALLPGAYLGAIHADGRLSADAGEKAARARSGALAVDMESHIAGAIAMEAGLPFAVLRCISDVAGASLPPAIAVSMNPVGGVAYGAVLRSVLRHPGQLPALMRTGRGFGQAFGQFARQLKEVGGRLGFDLR